MVDRPATNSTLCTVASGQSFLTSLIPTAVGNATKVFDVDSALTDTSKSFQVGKKGATASVECFWDETDTNGQIAIAEGSSVALNLYPEGATSGDYYYSGTYLITANSVSVPTDGIIEATFSATLTGALTRGTV